MKEKVIVGLSGGVDSAVAVINLLEQGYDVTGIFMRNWDSSLNNDILGNPHIYDEVCPQEQDYMDALNVANALGIPFERIDFVQEYWDLVFQYFLNEYRNNRTPNPDIMCNKEIKFKAFLKKALELGADYIAMGHYARTIFTPSVQLLRGVDASKDQSYFLCQLTKEQLAKTLFPIGHMVKKDVREKAKQYHLQVASKKDSTGVCFIGERNFREFLKNYLPAKPGYIKTLDGEIVGNHEGTMYYTIGQRKGLKIGGAGEPWFVLGKEVATNTLFVGRGDKQALLYSNNAIVSDVNWLLDEKKEEQCLAKFRYRGMDHPVFLKWIDDTTCQVSYPQTAKTVTPGQAAVFYHGEQLIGGGTISKVYMDQELRPY